MADETTANGSGAYALELVNISVHYGGVVALDGADLGVREGEVVAVMGPNGAGKYRISPTASRTAYASPEALR